MFSMSFSDLCSAATPKIQNQQVNAPMMALIAVAFFIVVMPLELSQLIFALIGAIAYAVLQTLQPNFKQARGKSVPLPVKKRIASPQTHHAEKGLQMSTQFRSLSSTRASRQSPKERDFTPAGKEVRKPSSMPIGELNFRSAGWESEVQELLTQIMPTAESNTIVQRLVRSVQATIERIVPEVEVTGFASGDLARGKAFGVAVPDVDIVLSVSPDVLEKRLQARFSQGRPGEARQGQPRQQFDIRKLHKSMIRVCTDKLVSVGGFKFRRSAFRGNEPKVTLLAPATLGAADNAIPVDFSVNSVTPFYNAALLTECGQIDPRAKELILLVKRWAKDRGICHAAKGHFSPYLWSLLTIFYLQVGVTDEGPILPPVECFEISSGLKGQPSKHKETWKAPKGNGPAKSIGELLQGFMRFYSNEFDWQKEAVQVRVGKRGPPKVGLPLHIMDSGNGATTEVGPSIEDPFDTAQNLGTNATAASLARLFEELKRADELCASGEAASLATLLSPWIPPEQEDKEEEDSPKTP